MAISQILPDKIRVDGNREGESRKTVRFYLEAEATCSWLDGDGHRKECKGWTRDVSQRGAYILASGNPPRGAMIHLVISLPLLAGEARPLRIEAEGLILRTDRVRRGLAGFAITNQRLILCSL